MDDLRDAIAWPELIDEPLARKGLFAGSKKSWAETRSQKGRKKSGAVSIGITYIYYFFFYFLPYC
ncbi:MAG: hypothetical protein R6V58_12020, partial [Planctomycetota bacterium]